MLLRMFLCSVLCVLLLPAAAFSAALRLTLPEKAPQGSAIIAKVTLDAGISAPADKDVALFTWLDKTIRVPVQRTGNTRSATVLLPIPVEAAKDLRLQVTCGKEKASALLRVQKVNWPVQQLTVDKQYVTPPKTVLDRIAAEHKKSSAILKTITPARFWQGQFVRPVPGVVTSPFGGKRMFNGELRSRHSGVDLRGAEGTPIKALAAGRIMLAQNMYYGGNMVYIDHGLGMFTTYGHMSKIEVKEGDTVRAGQRIGLVGATGRVTGPHLHLGLTVLGQAVNPLSLFPQK